MPSDPNFYLFSTLVWETFLQDRRDMASRPLIIVVPKDISCALETRCFSTPVLSEVKYCEIDVQEIAGTVNIEIWYCGRLGTYKKIGSKQVVGTVGSVTSTLLLNATPAPFSQYLPQRRTIKTVNENILSTDQTPTVETPYTKNIDKYFSFLIKWTGQMSITKFRAYVDPVPQQMDGMKEVDEITNRYIRPTGEGSILTTSPEVLPMIDQQSGFTAVTTPRWSEEVYQSLA